MLDFTNGKPWKLLLQFSIPMLIGNILMQLYNIVDIYIVGNYVGTRALAAVGASGPIIFALISFIIGIATGCTIIISQYFGAKDINSVKRAIETVTIFVLIAALVMMIIGFFLCTPLLNTVNTPADVFEDARIFYIITLIGILPLFGVNCLSAILRGLGDSKTPLFFMVVSSIINIILVLIFVPVLGLGIAGAAWATVLAQSLTVAALIYWLNHRHPIIRIRLYHISFDRDIFRNSIRIGLPNGIQQALVAIGMMALLRIVNRFDSNVLAAYSVASRIDSLASAPAMTFSIAIAAFVGQNIGARKQYRIGYGLRAALKMSSAIALVISVIIVLFRYRIMEWFATEAEPSVIMIGGRYLLIVGIFYIVFSTMYILNGVMRGAGDTLITMFITLLSLWLIRIPIASTLSRYIGSDGIWWSIPIAWSIGTLFAFLYYKAGRWKSKSIIKPLEPIDIPPNV